MDTATSGRKLNLAQLLRLPFQTLVTELHEALEAAGYEDIRPTHTLIFALVTAEGIRLTELAERAQLTKQLVNYLVSTMEEQGYVERVADPTDGRAKLVRLTSRGQAASEAGARIIASIEKKWADLIGESNMQSLRNELERLIAVVESESRMKRREERL